MTTKGRMTTSGTSCQLVSAVRFFVDGHRVEALFRGGAEATGSAERAVEAWLGFKLFGGNFSRDFFHFLFAFLQLHFAAARDHGTVFFEVVKDDLIGLIAPFFARGQS